jgi:hypothetical protein
VYDTDRSVGELPMKNATIALDEDLIEAGRN